MISVIRNHGEINQWDMIDEAGVSIRDFYQLKAYMEHKFDSTIQLKKIGKINMYHYLGAPKIEQQELVTD